MNFAPMIMALVLTQGPQISVPPNVQGDVNDFIEIPANTTGPAVQWYSQDSNLKIFPVRLLKDTKTAIVISGKSGNYKIIAWTGDATGPSPPAFCVVTVGAPSPNPPPGPGPEPTPTDPFFTLLQAAYSTDTDPNKAAYKAGLVRVFSTFPISDPTLTTVDSVLARLVQLRQQVPIADTAFIPERKAIMVELNSSEPLAPGTVL